MSAARSLDKELESVIKRAASDPDYRKLLRDDRGAALAQSDLCPAVQVLVMSVKTEQLEKMIDRELEKPDGPQSRTRWGCVGAGALVGGMLLFANSMTLGHSRTASYETHARHHLQVIAVEQETYREEHDSYASLEELMDHSPGLREPLQRDGEYEYEIVLDGDAFTATARHRTRPKTRRSFAVGPDREVRVIRHDSPDRP